MEGVLFGLRDGLEIMREIGVAPVEIRATGGGAVAPLWRQLQADVYGVPVHRLAVEEGAAYGAALLGHVAAGTFATVDEATAVVRTLDATEPDERAMEAHDASYAVYRRLYASLREELHGLSALADGYVSRVPGP